MKYAPSAALLAIGFVAAPAAAQTYDSRSYDSPSYDAQDSSGFTIGAVGGFDNITTNDNLNDTDFEEDDVVYGGKIGYDVDLGRFFVGAEGEITFSEVSTGLPALFVADDFAVIDANETYYAGGRIGYELGSRAAIYAKAGYSALQFDSTYFNGDAVAIDDQHVEGLQVGAGVQFDLSRTIRLNAEYRYSDLGEIEISGRPTDYDATRNQILAGVALRF